MKGVLRWAGAALALVVFVLLCAIGIGTSLPMYHVASCEATYREGVAPLYAAMEDDASSPAWRTDVASVRKTQGTGGKTRWLETDRYGHAVPYLEVMTDPDRGIVRNIDDPTLPFGGEWKIALLPLRGGGTLVRIQEFGTIYNPIFRLLSRVALGYTNRMHTYLADLGRKNGEAPAITCSARTLPVMPK